MTTELEDLNDAIATELRAAAARHNTSGASIARRLDVPPLYVQRRLAGSAAVSVVDLIMIAEGIGCHPLDVLAQVLTDRDRPARAARGPVRDMPGAHTTELPTQNRG